MPVVDALTSFQTCAAAVRPALRARLAAIEPAIQNAENEYVTAGNNRNFYTLAAATTVDGTVTATEMAGLYDRRMARKDVPGRVIYDQLMSAAIHGLCPYCTQRVAHTLDHYLPKTRFPALAVTPANLVPACRDCNSLKLNAVATGATDQTMHPYFDDLDSEDWLTASVVESPPAAVVYAPDPPAAWDNIQRDRLRHHFEAYGLGRLYGVHGNIELLNIRLQVSELFNAGGPDQVSNHLRTSARSHRDRARNTWQEAMYHALANNAWYCEGGFRQ